jgi:parvulin-like peptidyl-prolyl isomerase
MKIVSALVAVFLLTPVSTQAAKDPVVARINSRAITKSEFDRIYKSSAGFFSVNKPSRKAVLQDLIKRELGVQEAKKLGLHKDAAVQAQMDTVLYNALLERKLSAEVDKLNVSDSQAKAYYQKNPEIRTSHIFIPVRPGSDQSAIRKAVQRLNEIKSQQLTAGKMRFSEAAQKFSLGPSAAVGGDLDYKTRRDLDPAYYEAALKLSIGQVSGVVRSNYGVHLVKLTGKRDWRDVNQAKFKRFALEEKQQRLFDRYMATLRQKSKVVVNPAALGG